MRWIIQMKSILVNDTADSLLVKENYGKDDNGWCQSIVDSPSISGVEIYLFFSGDN